MGGALLKRRIEIKHNECYAHNDTLSLVQGHFGPFQPNIPLKVPLWLGLALHKRRKCRIQPPEWMHPDKLQGGVH